MLWVGLTDEQVTKGHYRGLLVWLRINAAWLAKDPKCSPRSLWFGIKHLRSKKQHNFSTAIWHLCGSYSGVVRAWPSVENNGPRLSHIPRDPDPQNALPTHPHPHPPVPAPLGLYRVKSHGHMPPTPREILTFLPPNEESKHVVTWPLCWPIPAGNWWSWSPQERSG